MLSPNLAMLVDIVGEAPALKLAQAYGGTKIYISARPNGKVAKQLGVELAQKLVTELGAGHFLVPLGPTGGQTGRRLRAAMMLAKGHSSSAVARAVDIHVRTAERIRAAQSDILPLFEALKED